MPDPTRFSGRRARLGQIPQGTSTGLSTVASLVFLAAHVPLAVLMSRTQEIATAHALLVFIAGSWWALSDRRVERVLAVAGYIVGGEVLWRLAQAQINWEFAKYALSAILLLWLVRHMYLKPPLLAVAYFALLMPSITLTLAGEEWAAARNQLSFNLSGPLALMISAWFFSVQRISAKQLRPVAIAVIGPAIGIATLAGIGTFSGDVTFSDASNFASSGGFGPNQVSAVLGLGAMIALFMAMDHASAVLLRVVMVVSGAALAVQSAMTFSRGGLYMAGGGAAIAACFALRESRLRSRIVPALIVIFLAGNYFVLPYLNAFTDGSLGERFQDTRVTGRDRLIEADIALWKDNLIFGVGPGEGGAERARAFVRGSSNLALSTAPQSKMPAHTEFSRMLSEHGTFGIAALVLLLIAGVYNVVRAPSLATKALVAGLGTWSALFMLSTAMRLVAPSFAFGLGFASFAVTRATQGRTQRSGHRRPLVDGHPLQSHDRHSRAVAVS